MATPPIYISTDEPITFTLPALWQATNALRWHSQLDEHGAVKVLQQLWQSSTGNQEWRDVPTE